MKAGSAGGRKKAAAAFCVLVVSCAVSCTLGYFSDDDDGESPPGPDAGAAGEYSRCDGDNAGARTTRPGPCAESGLECGWVDGTECGACASAENCHANRCYRVFGPPLPDFRGEDFLMRALKSDGGEGQRFRMTRAGSIEAVETALWSEGAYADGQGFVLDVYVRCNGEDVKIDSSVKTPPRVYGRDHM